MRVPRSGMISAATLVATTGDLSRFDSPRMLIGYLGLVSSEHSSGGSIRRGGITKTGNREARRMLIEAAWKFRPFGPPAMPLLVLRLAAEFLPESKVEQSGKSHPAEWRDHHTGEALAGHRTGPEEPLARSASCPSALPGTARSNPWPGLLERQPEADPYGRRRARR